ncbi:translationally-controlled tumor protein homolog [Branchiostoma lanceolatum]|uniref:translationally-controlled tumor protein homolog n=1 Tax=Branchiostoma lanceolatum TaxID=7740 RepID=UPI003451E82A
MIIYKDIFSGDELFSDTYKINVIDDFIYEVEGKITTEKGGIDESVIGANASAEEAGEGLEEGAKTGCNIVLANRLNSITGYTKDDYKTYIKSYQKRILTWLQANNPDRVAGFQAAAGPGMKRILKNFKNWEFFRGEKMDEDGMVALMDYREDGETPYMWFFKDGLEEEKV